MSWTRFKWANISISVCWMLSRLLSDRFTIDSPSHPSLCVFIFNTFDPFPLGVLRRSIVNRIYRNVTCRMHRKLKQFNELIQLRFRRWRSWAEIWSSIDSITESRWNWTCHSYCDVLWPFSGCRFRSNLKEFSIFFASTNRCAFSAQIDFIFASSTRFDRRYFFSRFICSFNCSISCTCCALNSSCCRSDDWNVVVMFCSACIRSANVALKSGYTASAFVTSVVFLNFSLMMVLRQHKLLST